MQRSRPVAGAARAARGCSRRDAAAACPGCGPAPERHRGDRVRLRQSFATWRDNVSLSRISGNASAPTPPGGLRSDLLFPCGRTRKNRDPRPTQRATVLPRVPTWISRHSKSSYFHRILSVRQVLARQLPGIPAERSRLSILRRTRSLNPPWRYDSMLMFCYFSSK